jgi:uncharacterized membrane protein SpoIIM required for sporulation
VISTRWIEQRRQSWQRLDELLDRTSRLGFASLGRSELQELGLLYRQIASDLAVLGDQPGSVRYAEYVNQLLARAHHTIYSVERPRPADAFRFVLDYPRTFTRNLAVCAVSAAIFLAASAVGASLAYRNPDFKARFLGPAMVETIARREMWTHSIVAIKPVASSRIMTNNMTVALILFAMGVTGGIGTFYMLVLNGLLLGVIGAACAQSHMSLSLWSFVAPHGVLELPALVIAGGAGLRLAQGMLFPGVRPRRQAVALAGTEAVQLMLGCLPILVVAGVIEAFVSPTELSIALKFVMAGALFVLLVAYLFRPTAPRVTTDSAA